MVLKERTANNVHTAFVEEAKAYQRLHVFAKKASDEELPQKLTCSEQLPQLKVSTRGVISLFLNLFLTLRAIRTGLFNLKPLLTEFTIRRCCRKLRKTEKQQLH